MLGTPFTNEDIIQTRFHSWDETIELMTPHFDTDIVVNRYHCLTVRLDNDID